MEKLELKLAKLYERIKSYSARKKCGNSTEKLIPKPVKLNR